MNLKGEETAEIGQVVKRRGNDMEGEHIQSKEAPSEEHSGIRSECGGRILCVHQGFNEIRKDIAQIVNEENERPDSSQVEGERSGNQVKRSDMMQEHLCEISAMAAKCGLVQQALQVVRKLD